MTRVLITGMGGFIGSHLMDHILATTDWEIVGLDSFRHKGLTERITDSCHYRAELERVTVLTHDLAAPISPILTEQIGQIDYVFHLAAESHVDRSIEHPVWTIKNNVDVTLNMLEYAREAKPYVFLQCSTDEVYGPAPGTTRHPEWAVILPSNPYSASKAAQEAACIAYWRTYRVPVIITNTMNNYGERQDPEKFVPMIIRSVSNGGKVPVHGKPGEIGSRFYLHARNHADALCWLIQHDPAMYPEYDRPARYNVVGDLELNNLEVAEAVAKCMGRGLEYELVDHHSTRPGHDLRYGLDGWKVAQMGWEAPLDFTESLKRTVNWYRENPSWLKL